MASTWSEPLEQTHVILLDYSAVFEAGHFPSFKKLTEIIISQKIQVILSASFNYYHTCVFRALNPNERDLLVKLEEFLDALSREKLLHVESNVMSTFLLLPQYTVNGDACVFASIHSAVLDQIRLTDFDMDFSICVFDSDQFDFYPDISSFKQSNESINVNPVAASSDYLDVGIYVNIGDNVFIDNGESVLLSEKISTGSEGLVFRTGDPKMVAKIYHRGIMTALRWMKLTRMTKMGLKAKGICWPTSLLYNQNHEPVGYLMPAAQGYTLGTVFDGQDAIMDRFPGWDRSSVVQSACQIFEKIIYLHLHGILLGDIQMKNIMIKSPMEVYLIDLDSVQLDDLPCPVGTEEFTPPELWNRSFSTLLRKSVHEDYSCGILVFSILFCGQYPYNQRLGKETLREEIIALAFPYKCGHVENSDIPLGGYDKIWQAIPSTLQDMFCRAFQEGKRYETVEWYAALDAYREQLSSNYFSDPQAYFLFPYTKIVPVSYEDPKPINKRSIRDSIIHVPEISAKGHTVSDRVMYNGRVTGIAFVNQEKLTELELKNSRKLTAETPAPSPEGACKSGASEAGGINNEKLHSTVTMQSRNDTMEKSKSKTTGRVTAGKSNKTTLLLSVLVLTVIVFVIMVYITYLS